MNPVANQRGFVNMASRPSTETCENNKQFETMSQNTWRVTHKRIQFTYTAQNSPLIVCRKSKSFSKTSSCRKLLIMIDDFPEGMKVSLLTHIAVQFILCA